MASVADIGLGSPSPDNNDDKSINLAEFSMNNLASQKTLQEHVGNMQWPPQY
jgi:hypothetical protein